MKKFTLGACLHQQECTFDSEYSDLLRFDMGCLQNPLEWVSLGWKEKAEEFVQSNATFVFQLVLVIEGARFSTFMFLLIQTAMLQSQMAQAITYMVLSGVCRKSKKIVRRTIWFTNEGMLERGKLNFPLSQQARTEAEFVHHV